jgi:hypothetical protein
VFRDCGFVQTAEVAQNKFKLSVACGLHLSAERFQTGTGLMFQLRALAADRAFAVDHGLGRALH